MVDGIAGSGKSTVLRSVQAWTQEQNHRVFRLNDWTDVEPPRFDQVADHDIYFTYEPTRTWIGRAIRYELSREDGSYSGLSLAHAFALDREIMYRRLIIPALEAGKTIIQDRGVCTSFVYQPIMEQTASLEEIQALPGNRLAMEHAPDVLILTKLDAQEAYERIQGRNDEPKGIFAQLSFLKQLEQRFQEPWLHELFQSHGTQLYTLDTSGALDASLLRAQALIKKILNSKN